MKSNLNDDRLEELASGLMAQFRIVRDNPEDVELEMKVYDSLSNGAGKILKAYMVDIAMQTLLPSRALEVERKLIKE